MKQEIFSRIEIDNLRLESEPYLWESPIKNLLVISRPYYPDSRGSFQENFRTGDIEKVTGLKVEIKQSSISEIIPKTIKGIHCERQHKVLVPVSGTFLFVEVDLRPGSSSFKKWIMLKIDADKGRRCAIFVPSGVGNSMYIPEAVYSSGKAVLQYSVTGEYDPEEAKRVVRYDDPELAIPWPIDNPVISKRDLEGYSLRDFLQKYVLRI